jgi:hypothetical protein
MEDSKPLFYEPVSTTVVETIISSLGLLTALSIKDVVTQLINLISPKQMYTKICFTLFTTIIFLSITIIVSYHWHYHSEIAKVQ